MSTVDCILFENFVKLLHSISQVRPRRADSPRSTNQTPKALELVDRWLSRVRQYSPPITTSTCKIFFRLLFPEEDVRRRYNLKETTLARSLAVDVFRLSIGTQGAGRALLQWSEYPDTTDKAKFGCLGFEVERILLDRYVSRERSSPSIQKIDNLLDELASLSGYSHLGASAPLPRRPRAAILRDLFLDLNPIEAKFLTQIILKDLRPVLYPLPEIHTTRALLHYKSDAAHILTKWEVMRSWNRYMPKVYRARATFDDAVSATENLQSTKHISLNHGTFSPLLGVPVEVPKSQKGVKLSHALSFFRDQDEVWAETKYDGERMQIHVDLTLPISRQITIFSKSKRNSTLDRIGTHPIIRAALRLPPLPHDYLQYPALAEHGNISSVPTILSSAILDAEMVCFSVAKGREDEFWRLRSLIESTARGVRSIRNSFTKQLSVSQESPDSLGDDLDMAVESLQSNGSDNGERHFKLVFFDVLSVNGSSLLDEDYVTRRAQLERLITQIPGYVSLSLRSPVIMSSGLPSAIRMLARIFSAHIADHQEGLILKAAKSHYNDHLIPWVKLKRDYIPGYGDTVDLVILGAGWNKNRARELRVSPETFTTFIVAALKDPISSTESVHRTPRFQILFNVEYGMDREQLETFNFYVKSSEIHPFTDSMPSLPYEFTLPQSLIKPAFMLSQPLLVELFGAGFTKEAGMKCYSLRFPRITKVWWSNERSWTEGILLEEFQDIARLSIGHESGEKWASRTVDAMWGCSVDTGPNDPQKIAEKSNEWYRKLLLLEMLDVDPTDRVTSIATHQTRNASSRRRKIPPTGTQEPSAKRQKIRGSRIPHQLLKSLGSMTNVMHTRIDAQNRQRPGTVYDPSDIPITDSDRRGDIVREEVDISSPSTVSTRHHSELLQPLCTNKEPKHTSPEQSTVSVVQIKLEPPQAQLSSGITRIDSSGHDEHCIAAKLTEPSNYWPTAYIHTPMVQFLQNAYVWIPRDANNNRPTNRPSALELVPQNRRIGVIYFLLIICGCRIFDTQRAGEQFSHADKCVIFVRTGHDPETLEGLEWLFNALESWRAELNKPGNKEMFVLDSDMLTYGSLSTFSGDVASRALWRSSRI